MNQSKSERLIEQFTARKLSGLQKQSRENFFRSTLAHLRRGIGRAPGEMPQLWGFFLEALPEEWMGDREPSREEWAIYTSLTLFALHQQGKDPEKEWMSQKEAYLGKSVARLILSEEDEKRVTRRFQTLATASSMKELSHYLRTMVQLLRSKNIPLDYPALAEDLFWYQHPDYKARVCLRWGQDFYRRGTLKGINEEKEGNAHE